MKRLSIVPLNGRGSRAPWHTAHALKSMAYRFQIVRYTGMMEGRKQPYRIAIVRGCYPVHEPVGLNRSAGFFCWPNSVERNAV